MDSHRQISWQATHLRQLNGSCCLQSENRRLAIPFAENDDSNGKLNMDTESFLMRCYFDFTAQMRHGFGDTLQPDAVANLIAL